MLSAPRLPPWLLPLMVWTHRLAYNVAFSGSGDETALAPPPELSPIVQSLPGPVGLLANFTANTMRTCANEM